MAGAKRLTKAQVIAEIAELSELDKKSVARVFDKLQELIKKQLGARGPGEFVIPGLLKLKAVKKPATKDREGINPFTKEKTIFKGKPASKKVRATALKALKDLIQ
jgi:nucleoid DNA-binding protein